MPKLSAADQTIIDDNPGKSPLELLDLGLSKKAYEVLTKESETEPKPKLQPQKVESTEKHVAPAHNPTLRTPQDSLNVVSLLNRNTGRHTTMSRKSAEQLVKSAPNQYQIV